LAGRRWRRYSSTQQSKLQYLFQERGNQQTGISTNHFLLYSSTHVFFKRNPLDGQISNRMCLSVCSVTNGGDAFSITSIPVLANTANSAVGTTIPNPFPPPVTDIAVCLYDFLIIAQGTDLTTGLVADRYCGNQLNPVPAGAPLSVLVCSK
jgi:hypothetical protein